MEDRLHRDDDERARRLRGRNLLTLAALLGLAVLFYAVTVARIGGAPVGGA